MAPKSLKGTWLQGLVSFLGPIIVIALLRWVIVEPFVIPSGSMIPNLLIHDHILVNKLAFGVRVPLGKSFLWQWATPEKGEVVVFRFPENPDVFYVKRVLATAGDKVEVKEGQVFINGSAYPQEPLEYKNPDIKDHSQFQYYQETSAKPYTIRYRRKEISHYAEVTVPTGHFFVMGDNRDQSSDSRVWGFVPAENAVGKAQRIWLSCDRTLVSAQFVCDPQAIRWNRLLKKVE